MTTAIICDDEPRLAQALRDQLRSAWPELDVLAVGHDGGEALDLIAQHTADIAFLDIRMPGLSGIEVARQIAGSDAAPYIVFVTAYEAHAIEAFEARAVDYLLKPVKATRLAETVARLRSLEEPCARHVLNPQVLKALGELVTSERKYLRWLNCGQGSEIDVIAASEVVFFQSRDKYTAVITADRERYIRKPLKDLMNELDPDEFWQVHRSAVISVSAIEHVRRDDMGRLQVVLRGSAVSIGVSSAFTGRFKQM